MPNPFLWLTSGWTLALACGFGLLARGRVKRPAQILATALALIGLIPILPSSGAVPPKKPSRQVVYRFDDHRYLMLDGYGCEGAINYVDDKRGIDSPMIEQFARVFLPRFIHADDDGNFIFVPYHEPSAFRVSYDHGKTFTMHDGSVLALTAKRSLPLPSSISRPSSKPRTAACS